MPADNREVIAVEVIKTSLIPSIRDALLPTMVELFEIQSEKIDGKLMALEERLNKNLDQKLDQKLDEKLGQKLDEKLDSKLAAMEGRMMHRLQVLIDNDERMNAAMDALKFTEHLVIKTENHESRIQTLETGVARLTVLENSSGS